jgi:hypothetical protein
MTHSNKVPQAEIDLLVSVAQEWSGQSQAVRYLLFLLVNEKEPSGHDGAGLLEIRRLERSLRTAFVKVLEWWSEPPNSDEPIHEGLREIVESKGVKSDCAFQHTGAIPRAVRR